ncbi:MAG TPA: tail fiber domain-containing protein [bacterium]|nr:tail fiber domain-containing protein [bacterium]
MRNSPPFAVVVAVLLAAAAYAAVPASMSVQGKLTDALGEPIVGSQNFTFKIFDAAVGGSEIWPGGPGETQSLNTDANGLWIGLVGAVIPLNHTVFQDTVRWLEITVNGTTLPRTRLVTGAYAHRVGTVDGASGGWITSKVTIGPGQTNTGSEAFVAGSNNTATGGWSNVGGGSGNLASGPWSSIGGGAGNMSSNDGTTVGGGEYNVAAGFLSTVGGGYSDTAFGGHSAIGGGSRNRASGDYSFIGGGLYHTASGTAATVAGGASNLASAWGATVGGGQYDTAIGLYSTIAGGNRNRAIGDGATVGGGAYCFARGPYSVVAGGGGFDSDSNSAKGANATIGGGRHNYADGVVATVSGGASNNAPASHATISGGGSNSATDFGAVVCGGYANTAAGAWSTVAGGDHCEATGQCSFAAGRNAKAIHNGSWVWGSSEPVDFPSTADRQFLIRAVGGVGINTNTPTEDLTINGTVAFENSSLPAINMFESGTSNADKMILAHSSAFPDWGLEYRDADDKFVFIRDGFPGMTIDFNQANTLVGFGSVDSPSNIITLPNFNSINGRALGFAWDVYSSRRWKTNIRPLDGSLDKVRRLQGVSYDPIEGGGRQIGLIAEDVGQVVPEVVQYEENGVDAKSIDYARLVALLIEGMKEQQKRIETLEATIRQMQP